MTEQKFWEIIESSWSDSPEINKSRLEVMKTNDDELLEELSGKLATIVVENYSQRLLTLDKSNFTDFLHILEEKLYKIDRVEIHKYTDGSDDGFLYCRCFILGMGEQYYNMVDREPSKATFDLEAETFGFRAYQVYKEKFGESFKMNSTYCIESCLNREGWENQ